MSPTESIPKYVVSELSSASVIIVVDGVLCVTGLALLLFLSLPLLLLLLLLVLFLLFATLFDSCCALPTRGKVASLGALPLLHPTDYALFQAVPPAPPAGRTSQKGRWVQRLIDHCKTWRRRQCRLCYVFVSFLILLFVVSVLSRIQYWIRIAIHTHNHNSNHVQKTYLHSRPYRVLQKCSRCHVHSIPSAYISRIRQGLPISPLEDP